MEVIILVLLSIMIFVVILGSYIILWLFKRSRVREVLLRANLIKQKEAVQQAERKSMNKSLAFASASHDVRNSLAGITGLIEFCRRDVAPQSELDINLEQMKTCALKLLEILNTILDTSKVEAGKMQLEEVEFDMVQVIEESIDIFHVVALKKGLEIVWDPCDCSVLKSPIVKGDFKRLKQIMDNLIGNAVKFTSVGSIVVRAWAKKPTVKSSEVSSKYGCRLSKIFGLLSTYFSKNGAYVDLQNLNSDQHDSNSIEFIFEVDDTGVGIPKEKRASVFENYVQVKESSKEGQEGTGLGLGIVQSFVRLMGGEISIQDKEPGESGTCFRFNIFMKSSETFGESEAKESAADKLLLRTDQNISRSGINQCADRALAFGESFSTKGVHTLLFVEGDETARILQRWMKSLGVKVWRIQNIDLLYSTFENIKHNASSSGKSDSLSFCRTMSQNSNTEIECSSSPLPTTARNGAKKPSSGGIAIHVLVIIDLSYGNLSEIYSHLRIFIDSTPHISRRVVYLADLNTSSADLEKFKQVSCDLILRKPIHGSRLCALLRLLHEFQRTYEGHFSRDEIASKAQSLPEFHQPSHHVGEASTSKQTADGDKPLNGMHILLAEDTSVLRHLAKTMLSRFGATVESAENGLEALNLIKRALKDTASDLHDRINEVQGSSKSFLYDLVLMDCEMPIMNGYEATKYIREEEKRYGIHIPIIALTGHATPEEEKKTILAGMDFHLTKPLEIKKLSQAINFSRKSVNSFSNTLDNTTYDLEYGRRGKITLSEFGVSDVKLNSLRSKVKP
ncbi:putative histidine kinase 2, partial [Ananas comosus]